MKNLVMGAARGYGWDELEPFVVSCKKNCPSAELVLFVENISDFTRDRLIRHGVTTIDIPAAYKNVLVIHARWKMYLDFLDFRDDFAQVFVTDPRDVIFQSDVFEPFQSRKNFLVYATEADDIGGSRTGNDINRQWLESLFGKTEADKLIARKVICCGTIVCSVDAMKILCRIMWETLKDDRVRGHEQAVMNYLVRNDLLPIENLIESNVFDGAIYTNALVDDNKIRGEKILRGDGGIPSVVHQYNRHDNLIWLVDRIYRDKNFQADNRFNDTRSAIEQATSLLHADKFDAAARLFIGKLFVTEDFSDFLKPLLRLWEIALRQNLTKTTGDIELAVQCALKTSKQISMKFTEKIIVLLNLARDSRHLVDEEFEGLLIKTLLATAQQSLAANEHELHQYCLKLLKNLGVNR